jgi:CubicO group peptidase (beta-lactamase class C family)
MLNHTSGLRDWGNVASIAGWPRRVTPRARPRHRQPAKALNFTPGTRWSYNSTSFNLAAMIVQRVGGMPFPSSRGPSSSSRSA